MNAPSIRDRLAPGAAGQWRTPLLILALAGVYLVTARAGLAIGALHGLATLVWPPTGIAVAALVAFGRGLWPGVALGAFAANLLGGAPLPVAAGIAAGNTLEALVAVALLDRAGFCPSLGRLRDVMALLLAGCVIATAVSATFGVVSGWLGGLFPAPDLLTAWITWWLGDAMGLLIFGTPLLILQAARLAVPAPRRTEAMLFFAVLLAVSALAFATPTGVSVQAYAFVFIVFPFVIWAGLRLGPAMVALTLLLIFAAAVYGTARGVSPFAFGSLHQGLLLLQTFMAVVSITGLVLAAVSAEREQVRAERDRKEAERANAVAALREADRRKDQFLAVLGHEMRNLLAPVRNSTEILRRLHLPDAPEVEQFGRIIERQVNHMARLMDDLLDVSRITRGTMHLDLRPIDLVETVRLAAEDHRSHLESAGLDLRVELPQGSLPVLGDRTRLSQVVGNLLHNARKFTPKGGQVAVRVRLADEQWAVVEVSDTGCGMTPEVLEHAFESFGASSGASGGLGIGLPLVRGLVKLHGGSVRTHSDGPDLGTTVVIRLPVHHEDRGVDSSGENAADQRMEGLDLLVIEADQDAATSLKLLLELHGHRVALAQDRETGLEAAAKIRPQVILCGIGRGGEGPGLDLARQLRGDPRFAATRMIALTPAGKSSPGDRFRAAGFNLHLVQPVEPKRLLAALTTGSQAGEGGA